MSEKKRKILTGAQKAKIALEAVKEQKTVNEIGSRVWRSSYPNRIMEEGLVGECQSTVWGEACLQAPWPAKRSGSLYAKIGQLNMELDWLKKSQGSVFKRKTELDRSHDELALVSAV